MISNSRSTRMVVMPFMVFGMLIGVVTRKLEDQYLEFYFLCMACVSYIKASHKQLLH